MHKQPLILGHRGSSAVAPENTVAAFKRAILDGADGIEFDVRLASDYVPVVIHDSTLARTASSPQKVSELTSSALRNIDAGKWFWSSPQSNLEDELIPTLEQVFDLFTINSGLLYLEMKGEPVGEILPVQVATLIRKYSFDKRVVVESFDLEAIAQMKRLAPDVRTAALFERRPSRPLLLDKRGLQRAHEVGADEIAVHHSLAGHRLVRQATESGFEVVVWTVDKPLWIERAVTWGIKALITNNPGAMAKQRGV